MVIRKSRGDTTAPVLPHLLNRKADWQLDISHQALLVILPRKKIRLWNKQRGEPTQQLQCENRSNWSRHLGDPVRPTLQILPHASDHPTSNNRLDGARRANILYIIRMENWLHIWPFLACLSGSAVRFVGVLSYGIHQPFSSKVIHTFLCLTTTQPAEQASFRVCDSTGLYVMQITTCCYTNQSKGVATKAFESMWKRGFYCLNNELSMWDYRSSLNLISATQVLV